MESRLHDTLRLDKVTSLRSISGGDLQFSEGQTQERIKVQSFGMHSAGFCRDTDSAHWCGIDENDTRCQAFEVACLSVRDTCRPFWLCFAASHSTQ